MTSRAIDYDINEGVEGGGGPGGVGEFWGWSPEFYWVTFTKYNIFWNPQLKLS